MAWEGSERREPPFATIAIVGVGLIGGSIGLAARARWPEVRVVGVDRPEVLRDALSFGAISDVAAGIDEVPAADLVVLAASVGRNLELLPRVHEAAPHAVVTDVGSTKRSIVAAARTRPGLIFVGGHPLAGAAVSGVSGARAQMFRGRPWILTPDAATPPDAVARVGRWVLGLGGVPEQLDADQHDRLVAFVSHLPQLAASGLLHTVGTAVGEAGLGLSGPGLADTTRLASSPPGIWAEILHSNADYVEEAIDGLVGMLESLKAGLRSADGISAVFTSATKFRGALRRVGEGQREPGPRVTLSNDVPTDQDR